jgi:hypothetical protein
LLVSGSLLLALALSQELRADGKLVAPKTYKGSLEEKAQEAIIIFHEGDGEKSAVEDLILKVSAEGEVKSFGWVIPFPKEPKAAKEDAKLFEELFAYVAARHDQLRASMSKGPATGGVEGSVGVEVLSRQTVGAFDVAVVREKQAGALNQWLEKEGFQTLVGADDIIGFYRDKGYVFACIKVTDAALSADKPVDLHPLRFSFQTGGRDGIYYPMRMTGLQKEALDINLYVFYRFWLNDDLNEFGYFHRGFSLNYRDWDTSKCVANGGKAYSDPKHDPFLKDLASKIPTVTRLLQKLHPGANYYLTNIQMEGAKPADIRGWSDDLWLFPYYVNKKFVPYDARSGGVAAKAWEN